jgi:hypothetical protein
MAAPAPSKPTEFDAALTRVEQALVEVGAHLADGQASELEAACQTLQSAMLDCSRVDPRWLQALSSDRALQTRLKVVRAGIAQVRENMARRAAAVQRSLQILLPTNGAATYGRGPAAYGAGQKSVASFTSLSA